MGVKIRVHYFRSGTDQNVGAGLPAMAVLQAQPIYLTHRHRGQARLPQ